MSAKWKSSIPIAGVALAAALAFPGNVVTGMAVGMQVRGTLSAVEDETAAGVPPEQVVRLFKDSTQANQEERAVRALPMLREARIGRFAGK